MTNLDALPLYDLLPVLVKCFHPSVYMEIGVNEGLSAKTVLEAGRGLIKEAFLCDNWKGYYGGSGRGSHDHVAFILDSFKFETVIHWKDGDSKSTVPTISSDCVSMALVDGDHSEEGCRIDMENTLMVLKPDGIMIVDDLVHPDHPYLQKVFDDFCKLHTECEVLRQNGIGVLKKSK